MKMSNARIYRPAKNAMQSGKARMKKWVLEFEPGEAKTLDPLMGWTGSGDTHGQVKLRFDSQQEAEAYAERVGLDALVSAPHEPKRVLKSYADRFAFDRVR